MVRARCGSWCAQRTSILTAPCHQSPCPSNKKDKDDEDDSDASDLVTNKAVSGHGSVTKIIRAKPTNSTTSSFSDDKSPAIKRRLPSKRSTRRQKTKVVSYVEDEKGSSEEDDGSDPSFSVSDKSDAEYDCQSNYSVSGKIGKTSAKKQAKRLINCSVESPKKQYKCNFKGCNRSYSRSDNLSEHLAKHRRGFDAKPFICDFKGCDRRFGSRSGLFRHSFEHTNKYKCRDCEKRCQSEYSLKVHRQLHTEEKLSFKCSIEGCDRQFSSRASLSQHKAQHLGRFECKECCKKCLSMHALKEHQRTLHTGEKPFKCKSEGCDRSYSTASALNKHSAEHSDKYKCSDCGKRCQSKLRLEDHRRAHGREKPLKCNVKGCGSRFTSISGFNDHKARHEGELEMKQFKCKVEGCGKRFKTDFGLILHNNEHQGKFFRRFRSRKLKRNDNAIVKKKLVKDLSRLKSVEKKQTSSRDKNKRKCTKRETNKRSPSKRVSKDKALEIMRNQFDNDSVSEWDDGSSGFSSSFSPENRSTDDGVFASNQSDISTDEISSMPEIKIVLCQVNLDNADAIDKTSCLITEKSLKRPTQQFKCNLKGCDRSFLTLFCLHRHKRRHQGRCRCEECYKRWNSKFNRNKHRRLLHCYCSKKFQTSPLLKNHKKWIQNTKSN